MHLCDRAGDAIRARKHDAFVGGQCSSIVMMLKSEKFEHEVQSVLIAIDKGFVVCLH
jgi:hypothetical protein